jgi:hypothetical protein
MRKLRQQSKSYGRVTAALPPYQGGKQLKARNKMRLNQPLVWSTSNKERTPNFCG